MNGLVIAVLFLEGPLLQHVGCARRRLARRVLAAEGRPSITTASTLTTIKAVALRAAEVRAVMALVEFVELIFGEGSREPAEVLGIGWLAVQKLSDLEPLKLAEFVLPGHATLRSACTRAGMPGF